MIITNLDKFFEKNPSVFNAYASIIKLNAKARIESQAIKTAVKTERMSNISEHAMVNYTPCTNSGKQWKEIFLVEGGSAGGSCRDASDPKTQAIFLLRGVVPNAFKCTLSQIMENREIRSLVTVLRCGIGKNFDISKMYFNRVNIFTDEDTDGFYISALLLAFFYKFMPELIVAGYIWKVYTPLYQLSDNTFIGSKAEMSEVDVKKLVKNYKIKLIGQKDYMSKSELKSFLYDTLSYANALKYAAESAGEINKFLIEVVTANLTISNDLSDVKKLLDDQKFVKLYMGNIQKKYKEIKLKKHTIYGVADNKYYTIHICDRFMDKVDTLIPVYRKYGYEIIVQEKEREPIKMTIGEFLDSCSKYYADILHRFKGLSEINAKDLHDNAMDFNHRYSVVYTMESAKKELETFMTLFADTAKYPEKRKDMMTAYKINREDLDN
jgi:DNA gyrase subunit B